MRAAAGLGVLAAFVLRSALLSPALVATGRWNDVAAQFAPWRSWGFAELAAGRFPLWSPWAFGGHPFHGSFEPALLYPPNWLHLVLPLEAALDAVSFLHVWLAGALACAWARRRGASEAAAFAGGAAYMLCGPFFLRLYAGHLPYLCGAAWLPGLLLCVDELRRAPSPRWTAAAAACGALIVLAGNPQAAWLAALAAALHAVLEFPPRGRRAGFVRALASAALGAAALSAAQWLPGLEAASESLRWSGAPGGPASFALTPGALPSLVLPAALSASLRASPYFWESSLHFGAPALALALWAGVRRPGRPALAAAAILLLLAFGAARFLPLGSLFRAPARLALPACAFLSALCAAGVDLAAPRFGRWAPALPGLAIFASAAFGALNAPAETIARDVPPAWEKALAAFGPGERALFDMRTDPDAGIGLGAPELWGYGQLVPRRWAELLFASQGLPPAEAGSSLIPRRDHPVMRLLRARAVLRRAEPFVRDLPAPLPRLLLAREWSLAAGRDEALAAVLAPGFDPARRVVLERAPVPAPDPAGRGGSARVVAEDSDSLEIEAELAAPAVLVLADSYARGWRADARPGSAQAVYEVLPADWALRAVPLSAGTHRFVLRYAPASFAFGVLLTLLAVPAVAALGLRA